VADCGCNTGDNLNISARDANLANIGSAEVPQAVVDRSRSRCYGARPVVSIQQGQATRIRLYLADTAGGPIAIPDGFSVVLIARDTEQSSTSRLGKTCSVETASDGKVLCTLAAADTKRLAGVYVAQLQLRSGTTIHATTDYWLVVNSTLGMAYKGYGVPSLAEIRMVLRDVCPEQNFLTEEYEFDDSQIVACIRHPIDEFNERHQPHTSYTPSTFPYRFHWLRAICAYLMEIAARGYSRDHLPYNAAGVTVDDKNKYADYMTQARALLDEWRKFIDEKKMEINIEGGFARLGSAYE